VHSGDAAKSALSSVHDRILWRAAAHALGGQAYALLLDVALSNGPETAPPGPFL
jgi:hypothetical protein